LRLSALARSIAASATAAPTSAAATLLIRSCWPAGFRSARFPGTLGTRRDRDDSGQPARAAPPAGLFARTRIDLLDPLIEFGQPLFHGPLDLWAWGAWFLGPDARPLGANGFGRGVGVSRLGLERDLRREFRHLRKS
jgi:hypothetical protein